MRLFKPFTNLKNLKRAWAFSFFKFLIGYNEQIEDAAVERDVNKLIKGETDL